MHFNWWKNDKNFRIRVKRQFFDVNYDIATPFMNIDYNTFDIGGFGGFGGGWGFPGFGFFKK